MGPFPFKINTNIFIHYTRFDTILTQDLTPFSHKETEEGVTILKEIKRLRRKRKGMVKVTFNEIADVLNDQGYRAANGKLFSGNTVRGILHRQKKR